MSHTITWCNSYWIEVSKLSLIPTSFVSETPVGTRRREFDKSRVSTTPAQAFVRAINVFLTEYCPFWRSKRSRRALSERVATYNQRVVGEGDSLAEEVYSKALRVWSRSSRLWHTCFVFWAYHYCATDHRASQGNWPGDKGMLRWCYSGRFAASKSDCGRAWARRRPQKALQAKSPGSP